MPKTMQPSRPIGKKPNPAASPKPAPSREQIAERAYALWQSNGGQGDPEAHWLEAERQLTTKA